MTKKRNTKQLVLSTALILGLLASPTALAAPNSDAAVGFSAIADWFHTLWDTLNVWTADDDAALAKSAANTPPTSATGPAETTTTASTDEDPGDETSGPMIIPNG